MYWHEWIAELEILPVWESFLVGVIVGMVLTLTVIAATEDRK